MSIEFVGSKPIKALGEVRVSIQAGAKRLTNNMEILVDRLLKRKGTEEPGPQVELFARYELRDDLGGKSRIQINKIGNSYEAVLEGEKGNVTGIAIQGTRNPDVLGALNAAKMRLRRFEATLITDDLELD